MNPDLLREKLDSAIARGDNDEFRDLCSHYEALILESFASWTDVPVSVRGDRDALEAWLRPVAAVALHFKALGHPELLERLSAGPDDSLKRWSAVFMEALQLSNFAQYAASTRLLLEILPEIEGASGDGADAFRSKSYALLGKNYFKAGDVDAAFKFTSMALADSQRVGDREGVATYTNNLRLLSRTRENVAGDEAVAASARLRARIAKAQDRSDDARYESSNALLREVLAEMDESPASPASEYRGKVNGLLGLNFFRLGDLAQSQHYTELALQDCTRVGDEEGVRIYSANLKAISEAQTV